MAIDIIRKDNTDVEICGAKAFTETLTVSGWNNKIQTVENALFVDTGYSYIITPAYASLEAWQNAEISIEDVDTDGECTFHCKTVPTAAIALNITRVVVR